MGIRTISTGIRTIPTGNVYRIQKLDTNVRRIFIYLFPLQIDRPIITKITNTKTRHKCAEDISSFILYATYIFVEKTSNNCYNSLIEWKQKLDIVFVYGGIFLIFILPNETSKGEKDRNGLNKFKFSNAIYLAFLSKALPIDSYNLEKKIYQHSKME